MTPQEYLQDRPWWPSVEPAFKEPALAHFRQVLNGSTELTDVVQACEQVFSFVIGMGAARAIIVQAITRALST
jgi:hypothetical protein